MPDKIAASNHFWGVLKDLPFILTAVGHPHRNADTQDHRSLV